MKVTEGDTKSGKIFHAHRLEKQVFLKCLYCPQQSTHLMQSLSKYHQYFFIELKETVLKCVWNEKGAK